MTGPAGAEDERQWPALTVLDVMTLSPVQVYGVITLLAASRDEAVAAALSDAVARVLIRSRPVLPPPA